MSADELVAAIRAELEDHKNLGPERQVFNIVCACGHVGQTVSTRGEWEAHLDAALAPVVAEILAERDRETAELTRRATNDPGAFTRRGIEDGTEYGERLDRWQTRAIETAITERPTR